MRNYDEEAELDRYVINYYPGLMTTVEAFGQKAAMVEAKARNASPHMAEVLRAKWGHRDDPEVIAALSEGVEVFQRRVRERILRDHSDKVFINRCPKCNRVVETPKAKLCLWCGHSWHKEGG